MRRRPGGVGYIDGGGSGGHHNDDDVDDNEYEHDNCVRLVRVSNDRQICSCCCSCCYDHLNSVRALPGPICGFVAMPMPPATPGETSEMRR